MEILVLWVLVVLTIRTYLQETAPKANEENISRAGWTRVPNDDAEDPYLVFTRGREALTIHGPTYAFVHYTDGVGYWKDEDIRGDVVERILTLTPGSGDLQVLVISQEDLRIPATHTHTYTLNESESATHTHTYTLKPGETPPTKNLPSFSEDVPIRTPSLLHTLTRKINEQRVRTSKNKIEKTQETERERKEKDKQNWRDS
jgi:hypothetical protein